MFLIRSANSGSHAASSESRCDSNAALYTTMLPLSPSAAHNEAMKSRRGSLLSDREEFVVLGFCVRARLHMN